MYFHRHLRLKVYSLLGKSISELASNISRLVTIEMVMVILMIGMIRKKMAAREMFSQLMFQPKLETCISKFKPIIIIQFQQASVGARKTKHQSLKFKFIKIQWTI